MKNESAVSEIIGAILLVSLVVLGVMIVSVSVLSQPPPEDIPQITALADNSSDMVFLYHTGGDSLQEQEIRVMINGQSVPFSLANNESWPWTLGKTLEADYPGPGMPEYVQLVYTGGSSENLILTTYFVPPSITGAPTAITTTPTPTGTYYIITASSGPGGYVSPSGSVSVTAGGSQSFAIVPEPCYSIADVKINGGSIGPVSTYTFTNVNSNQAISATFTLNALAITASAGTGGTITPSGMVPASCHGSQTFSISNNTGYWIQNVVVDGSSVGAVPSYTFTNIIVNHTISATFTNVAPTTTVTTTVTTTATTSPTPTPAPDCGTISGYKYNDLNGNGNWDAGEPGLSGWTIQIYEKSGSNWVFVTSVTTGTGGYYIATGLQYHPANQYLVKEIVQSGWQRTYPVNEDYYNFIVLNLPHCYETGINFGNRQVLPPVADFIGTPTSGYAPLTVQFTDTSTGNPTQWAWDVNNDGTTDYTTENPSHTYLSQGIYSVKLTATNAGGSATKIRTGYITVNAPLSVNIYLNADKEGLLHSGDYIQFRVTGQNSFIKHGNSYYSLSLNDIVKMALTSDVKGSIYATSTYISDFRFDNVILYINGDDKGTKDIGNGDIWISSYDSYASTLSIIVPADNEWTHFQVNNPPPLIYGEDNRVIQVLNLQPGQYGLMNLDNRNDVFYNGGATGYSIT
jgi:PKD repeat protein